MERGEYGGDPEIKLEVAEDETDMYEPYIAHASEGVGMQQLSKDLETFDLRDEDKRGAMAMAFAISAARKWENGPRRVQYRKIEPASANLTVWKLRF